MLAFVREKECNQCEPPRQKLDAVGLSRGFVINLMNPFEEFLQKFISLIKK